MSERLKKVNSTLEGLISQFLAEHSDEFSPYFLTLKRVEVSKDLRHAKVWVAVIGKGYKEEEILRQLEGLRADLQSYIGERITFKFNPKLRFLIDHTGEKAQRVEEILRQIKEGKL